MNAANSTLDQKKESSVVKKCDFCGAEAGQPHPTRGFEVKLTPVIGGDHSEQACQVCRVHYRKKEIPEKKLISKNKSVFLIITLAVTATVIALSLLI
ncbi:MAG TPA: hypothetical protein DEQ34_09030 [Balneolaceae bacterium]|nr:hypothetical protein [Balneolaceae bacterium]|tara:strand:- start:134433 stop:134723 length:291 start_codon:yes stop_codon:yes gene_type:complete